MFLVFFFFFLIFILGLIFSKVKLVINKLELDNTVCKQGYLRDIDGRIKIYLFGIIKILSIKINKTRIKKASIKNFLNKDKLTAIEGKIAKNVSFKDIKEVKNIKINLEKLDMNLNLGTEDVIITSLLIFVISNIVTFIVVKNINKTNKKKYHYIINPCYQNKNVFILDVNCIISIKTVHIINMLYRFLKRSEKKDERASNRRSYDDCNEQYPKYDRCKYNYRGANRNI